MAPVFITIMMGVSEATHLFELQNQLALAAREGARLAAMDRTGMLEAGETTNQKIVTDVKNFLTANGMSGDSASVFIVDADDSTTTFDLDNPANDLELFELRVELPYSAVAGFSIPTQSDWNLTAKVIFRNARAVIIQ